MQSSELQQNPFARALCTPVRVDRHTKMLKVPRALLIPFSLFTRSQGSSSLWLVPNVQQLQSGLSNGYATNSAQLLQKLKSSKWHTVASLDLLMDAANLTKVRSVQWNPLNWKLVNTLYCNMMLELVGKSSEGESMPLVIRTSGEECALIHATPQGVVVNMSKIVCDCDEFEQLKSVLYDGMIIRNTDFIDTLLKFIAYNS